MPELPPTHPRHIVRIADAAKEAGISPTTLRKHCRELNGPQIVVLATNRFGVRRGELDAWLQSRRDGTFRTA